MTAKELTYTIFSITALVVVIWAACAILLLVGGD